MKTYLDCFPCFMNQALRAGRIATQDDRIIRKLLDEIGSLISEIPLENTPPEMGALVYQKISEITGNSDPYEKIKTENIALAEMMYPRLKQLVLKSEDRLLTAIRLAIAGNVIDFGTGKGFDLEKDVEVILQQEFAIFDYSLLRQNLISAQEILYIGDNAGEGVFDKILIEELGKPVTYAVRGIPVINDITIKEAKLIGLDKIARVISSGSIAPGAVLKYCNAEFLDIFAHADLIIAKGQGNYEGLSAEIRPIFFLLKAKCPIIAKDIGVKENDIILKGQNSC